MNEATADLLLTINREFYAAQAQEFSASRAQGWPGFSRVLDRVAQGAPRVLDVGCGNGRFVATLRKRFPDAHYVGIDGSDALLAVARERFASANTRFVQADFVGARTAQALPEGPYDLVTLFAVLHHVPQEHRRRALIAAAAACLGQGGVLAFTLWRFDEDPRFATRDVAPAQVALPDGRRIDAADLDTGDHLLRWGNDERALRYCHFVDDAELARLLEGLDLVLVDRFRADGVSGVLNDYLLLQRPNAS